jgi:hypothetical protein
MVRPVFTVKDDLGRIKNNHQELTLPFQKPKRLPKIPKMVLLGFWKLFGSDS